MEQELRRWREEFSRKHGAENVTVFDASKIDKGELFDAVAAMPFIGERRLVIVRGMPRLEKDDIASLLTTIHPAVLLVIADGKLDQRLGAVKALIKVAEMKKFPTLTPEQLCTWAIAQCHALGAVMPADAAAYLVRIAGTDQGMLFHEVQKLALIAWGREVTIADIDALAVPAGSEVIWRLTDLVSAGRAPEAVAYVRWRLDRGDDVYGMWSVLVSLVRNLCLVASALHDGISREGDIAEKTGLHPFVARNLLPLARSLRFDRVQELITWCAEVDVGLKTGVYHYSSAREEELIALVERLILRSAAETVVAA